MRLSLARLKPFGKQVTFRRIRAAVTTVALAGLVLPFGVEQPAAAASDSTLTIGIAEHGSTLNPFTANLDPDLNALALIYPTLVWADAHGTSTHYLADKWTTSPDKLTWTFDLHPGLKWTDGKAITAADVAWTFNLIMTNTGAATANGQLVSNFASVTAPDDTTVVLQLGTPSATLPLMPIPILPEHIWKDVSKDQLKTFADEPSDGKPIVGSGPFMFVSGTAGGSPYKCLQSHLTTMKPSASSRAWRSFSRRITSAGSSARYLSAPSASPITR